MDRKTGLRNPDIAHHALLDHCVPRILDEDRCTNLLHNSELAHQVCATRNPLLSGTPMIGAQTFVCAITTASVEQLALAHFHLRTEHVVARFSGAPALSHTNTWNRNRFVQRILYLSL